MALALLLGAGAPGQTPEVRGQMERALGLLEAGAAEAAIPLLLAIVDELPLHGPARLQLGALAVERGEWAVARDHLRAAAASVGSEAPEGAVPVRRPGLAWTLLGEALGRLGALEEALGATARALEFAPAYVPALLQRADFGTRLAATASSRSETMATALGAARRAVRLAPDRPAPWTVLALAAEAAAAGELARCAAERARELAPDDPAAALLVARLLRETDPPAALEAAEAALVGKRDDAEAWMLIGGLRAFRMELTPALAAYTEALRLDPAVAGEMASPALDALVARADPELLDLLRERAELRPEATETRFALAKADLRNRPEAALDALRRLAAEDPHHAAVLTALHAALRLAGDSAAEAVLSRLEAVKAADAAAWEQANAAERRRREARAALASGDPEAARRLQQTVLAGPADWSRLGRALHALGRRSEALDAWRRSLALRPFDPETLRLAADAETEPEASARHRARAALATPDCDRLRPAGEAGAPAPQLLFRAPLLRAGALRVRGEPHFPTLGT